MGRGALAMALALGSLASGCGECRTDRDCDDGLFCTGEEACRAGSCVPGAPVSCDDGLACTTDRCDEEADRCFNLPEDRDGDGHFAPGCGGEDCDDRDPAVHPGAAEVCNGVDDDCDGIVLEDRDGDGFFDPAVCPEGDDCDDTDPGVHPGAPEVCDGVDRNCVLGTDDEADTDLDGFIDPSCGGDDCDDEDPERHPGAPEVCNGRDDDCDGAVDEDFECIRGEDVACQTRCGSAGTARCSSSCAVPTDPAACRPPEETCNGRDDDCDGAVDEGFECAAGQLAPCTTRCGTLGTGRCTDRCTSAPAAQCAPPAEECNGLDDDCNGLVDDGFECSPGERVECVTSCGTIGSATCGAECRPPASELACTPPFEVCFDLVDNDCDGDVDCTDLDCVGSFDCGF